MATTTDNLLKELKNAKDINAFLNNNEKKFINETPCSLLNEFLSEKNMSIPQVIKNSGAGDYVYKIFNGTRKPSRQIILTIAFGLGLSFEETQLVLRVSKLALLDSRDKRDSIIIYALVNHLSVFQTDDLLAENGFVTLQKDS